ncbi:MAG: hypothetical protein H0U76_25945 [Ktedonobacteraceae bacterium]|nr:hypothetical protein [Ktedonobacteraceae bacterium]
MLGKRWPLENAEGSVPQDACDMVRATLLEVQSPVGVRILSSAQRLRPMFFRSAIWAIDRVPSAEETITNEVIQGDEWTTYVALGRTEVTEQGITYQPRGSG